jgi:hypothetical protein
VQWLSVGSAQVHVFERDVRPLSHQHFGLTVDDLAPVFRAAERREAFDREAFGHHLVLLPGDVVQLYVRDPAGNLVEIDHAGLGRLPADVRAQVRPIEDINPQDDEQRRGRLFVGDAAPR